MEKQNEIETPWLKVREAAQYLRLKYGTMRNYINKGLIPVHRHPVTGTVRLLKSDLDAWVMTGSPGASEESRKERG